ncbi:MAG: NAD-dependent epimerase/dehydratase family protein [Flavobacteriaceae bacterium]|nr:NAD-dependent epimerase/dehydratase family protein [Flavobacteriaceae bacterium]
MILVTGATGLVGSHLLYALAKGQKRIVALYRSEAKKQKVSHIFKLYAKDAYLDMWQRVIWRKADITDIPALKEAMQGIDLVYHAAGYISFHPKDEPKLRKINIEGTANIVNLCLDTGVQKLCHISSIATLGQMENGAAITDETAVWGVDDKSNVYAITKYGGEMEVWRGTQEGLAAVILNPGVILGPHFWEDGSGTIWNMIAKSYTYTLEGGSGFISVDAVVSAAIAAMESNRDTERYIVVSHNWTFLEMGRRLAVAIGVKPPQKTLSKTAFWWLWALQSLLAFFVPSSKNIFKHQLKQYGHQQAYSSKKLQQHFDFEFEDMDAHITAYAKAFRARKKGLEISRSQ